jgi:hypothetical protein
MAAPALLTHLKGNINFLLFQNYLLKIFRIKNREQAAGNIHRLQ